MIIFVSMVGMVSFIALGACLTLVYTNSMVREKLGTSIAIVIVMLVVFGIGSTAYVVTASSTQDERPVVNEPRKTSHSDILHNGVEDIRETAGTIAEPVDMTGEYEIMKGLDGQYYWKLADGYINDWDDFDDYDDAVESVEGYLEYRNTKRVEEEAKKNGTYYTPVTE